MSKTEGYIIILLSSIACLLTLIVLCTQAVKEQFPEDYYDLTQSVIMFSVDDDPAISIEFERNLSGWICSLQGSDKVQCHNKVVCYQIFHILNIYTIDLQEGSLFLGLSLLSSLDKDV